jgi:hypothetical protein
MGYFDALTSSRFKKDQSGRSVFYPWGIFGKGRVLPDEETENRVRGFVRRYYMISLPVIIIAGVTIGFVSAFVLAPILIVWYQFESKALIAGCSVSDDKLTLKESFANQAKVHNKKFLWLCLILSIPFVAVGLLMFIHSASAYDRLMGAFLFLFFGVSAVTFGYMIKVRRT